MASHEPIKPEYTEPDFTPFQEPTRFLTDLWGFIPIVTSVPTHVPRKFSEQFRIYVNGSTFRFYWYDVTNAAWRYSAAFPISESDITLTDVTTNNASTAAHGFLKKLDNDATHFMDGQGNWDTVKDSDLSTSDITTNDVSTSKHGFVPKAPNDTTKFLRGDGTWAVTGGMGYVLRQTANGSFAPADATTYYVGPTRLTSLSTASGGSTRLYIPKAGTIKAAYGSINVAGTLSSGEDSTVAIRLNDTTNTNISTTVETNATNNAFSNSSLNIAVSAGDFIDILLTTPTWTTNPTSVDMTVSIYIE